MVFVFAVAVFVETFWCVIGLHGIVSIDYSSHTGKQQFSAIPQLPKRHRQTQGILYDINILSTQESLLQTCDMPMEAAVSLTIATILIDHLQNKFIDNCSTSRQQFYFVRTC